MGTDGATATARVRLRVRGTVQGVGFRPFVYGLAHAAGLSGFVLNDPSGVLIEIEGTEAGISRFRARLAEEPPAMAAIDHVDVEVIPSAGSISFEILESSHLGAAATQVAADAATCDECLAEIADPAARRYRYPFTNCTNCGPRFTIVKDVPYDRPNTTMDDFEMCAECKTEYEDPADRRFHAQPIACPACGPSLRLLDAGWNRIAGDPILETASLVAAGRIVAVKGLGGYHLACDATNEAAVERLRSRKQREEKPLAVMVANLEAARALCEVGDVDAAVLSSRRRPIVLLPRSRGSNLAPSVAPGNRFLGLMLPYTPLHHLLIKEVGGPLVLTSGNHTDEPIVHHDEQAFARLGEIADAFLIHDREIHVRCDDSVVRVVSRNDYPLRRSRGFAPEAVIVRPFSRPVLAAGGELKHTFCIGVGERAILSHHIGDLATWEAMSALLEGVEHFTRVFDAAPEVVAYDLHPEYLSTKWAKGLDVPTKIAVQHHHAHIASCLADNGREGPVIGLALDGTGWGDDDTIWGCEVLECDFAFYRRRAHLRYIPLPGGEAAIKQPWRVAAVYLREAFGEAADELALDFVRRTRDEWRPILSMAASGINSPPASSAGRLFDAVAALSGLRDNVTYEGQAAAELEQIADPSVTIAYPCSVRDSEIDGVELVAAAAEDLAHGRSVGHVSAAFHNGLARSLVQCCRQLRVESGLDVVALSGGTWQNLLLLERVAGGLTEDGFEVLIHRRVPPNDGGLALGQAVVANSGLG